MPECVVDVLEPIEVDEEHSGALAALDRRLEPSLKQGAVGEPGQRVVGRLVFGDGDLVA